MKEFNKECTRKFKLCVIGTLCGALATAVIISVIGLAVHGIKYLGGDSLYMYSLDNRFEATFSFKTPEERKFYYSTPNKYGCSCDHETVREWYSASPYVTYTMILLGGFTGAIAVLRKRSL